MFPIPWYVAVFASIPEAFLIQSLTLKLMNEKDFVFYNTFKVSILYGAATFIIRNISFYLRQQFLFSLHTILLISILILLFSLIHKIKIERCFMPVFIISLLYGLIQFTFILIVFNLLELRVHILQENPWINIALFFPIAYITYLVVNIYTAHVGEKK